MKTKNDSEVIVAGNVIIRIKEEEGEWGQRLRFFDLIDVRNKTFITLTNVEADIISEFIFNKIQNIS